MVKNVIVIIVKCFSVHNAPGVMETVGKQVQVVSGLGVGGPVGPVGPVGADLHHHHHSHPHGGHGHGHSLVGTAATSVARGQAQSHQSQAPPPSHNQHLPARSTPVQLHRSVQSSPTLQLSLFHLFHSFFSLKHISFVPLLNKQTRSVSIFIQASCYNVSFILYIVFFFFSFDRIFFSKVLFNTIFV